MVTSRPVRRCLAALVAVALSAPLVARADSPALAEARLAIRQVKYDRAQARLVEALHEGGHAPAELREILQLAGTTAIVLGQREVGDQYFRQLLALAPDATLPAGVAPKLRDAFVAAQAAMAALGRLTARARIDADGALVVEVTADPLHQAVAIDVVTGGGIEGRPLRAGAATGPGPTELTDLIEVRVLDGYGNQLLVIAADVIERPAPATVTPPPAAVATPAGVAVPPLVGATGPSDGVGPRPAPPPTARPRWRRWSTWAIPTVVGAGVGVGFAIGAAAARDERDRQLGEPAGQFSDAYAEAVADAHDRQLVSNLAFVATGVIAVTGAVMVLTWQPPARVTTALRVDADGAGVVVSARW
ncbi:MAG: hypothetical protein JNK64_36875 [Myxococcales bacterium]|nr:hypothetical protein [Myxococcales bacterium]